MSRTDRLYTLVEELRAIAPRPRSARWLAERFEVSSRTIERDLSTLQQAGVPIYATTGRSGGYAIDRARTLPPLNFSAAEATAIAIALGRESATPFVLAGRAALRKVLGAMAAVDAQAARELGHRVRLFSRPEPARRQAPASIEQAIVERLVVRLTYEDKTGASSVREVEPLGVIGVDPSWYLVAWCRLRDGQRTFRLDRITGAALTTERAPDRGLDPATFTVPDMMGRPALFAE